MLSPGGLTQPERELLALVAAGHPADRIAELLQTSRYAVEHRKRRIYAKLHAVNQSHAIARAAALGIVDRPVAARPGGPPTSGGRAAGGGALVVLRGPAGPARQRVAVTLLARQLAFAVAEPAAPAGSAGAARPAGPAESAGSAGPAGAEPWAGWHRGPVFLVLVDPGPGDWYGVDRLAVPVLWICPGPVPPGVARAALTRGVVGVLPLERIEELLAPALTLAGAGCLTVAPQPAAELVSLLATGTDTGTGTGTGYRTGAGTGLAGGELPELTVREAQILRSIAAGDTVRQTARALGITPKTVENTQARLFRKLGCRNRAGTLARALDLGLLALLPPGARPPAGARSPAGTRPAAGAAAPEIRADRRPA